MLENRYATLISPSSRKFGTDGIPRNPNRLDEMKTRTASLAFGLTVLLVGSSHAATTFLTNNASKILASDEGDAAALEGDGGGDTTTLTLSADDGGETIDLTSSAVFNGGTAQTLGMSTVGMGIGNDKWGNGPQGWTFSFDQPVGFDGIGFNDAGGSGEGLKIESTAWANETVDASGQNWTFTSDGTSGQFNIIGSDGPAFDFTSAGVSDVAAGTPITIEHNSGNGGSSMTSFTITAIPEPSTALISGLFGVAFFLRRRR